MYATAKIEIGFIFPLEYRVRSNEISRHPGMVGNLGVMDALLVYHAFNFQRHFFIIIIIH